MSLSGNTLLDIKVSEEELCKKKILAVMNCKSLKQNYRCAAAEMYEKSAQFRAQKELFEFVYSKYMILSTKYGLIDPADIIEPYDITIYDKNKRRLGVSKSIENKEKWSEKVINTIKTLPYEEIHFHISKAYWDPLEKAGIINLSIKCIHISQQVNPGLVILRYKEALEYFKSKKELNFSILSDHRESKDPEIAKKWYHPIHGEFFGFARDVSKNFNVDEGNLCRVSRSITKQTRGWVIDSSYLPRLVYNKDKDFWRIK